MATEVGAAYVRLLPSMQGFTAPLRDGLKKAIESAGSEAGDKGGEAAGGGFMDKLKDKLSGAAGVAGKILGKAAKYAGFAGAAVSGLIAKAGITRLVGLENANKSLVQMGLNGKKIDSLMVGLLKTLKGTPYALNEGAGAMAALVSAGAPLKRVNKYMDLIADSAAFAQAPLSEVARVFQKIQSQGKIQGDEIMSLSEMGLPSFQILAAGTGKSVDSLRKKMKDGEFTAKEFFDGWEKGSKGFGKTGIKIEGAAQSAGDTTTGAFANMKAAAGRLGASILGKPFASTKTFFNGVTKLIDETTIKIRPFVARVNEMLAIGGTKAQEIVLPIAVNVKDAIAGVDWVGVGATIKAKFVEIGGPAAEGLKEALTNNDWGTFGSGIGESIGAAFEGAIDIGTMLAGLFSKVDWWNLGMEAGKQAIGFALGFVIGLFAKTDWGAIGKKMWENKGALIATLLFVFPIGKLFSLAGKLLGKVPVLGKLFGPLLSGIGKGMQKLGGWMWKGIQGVGKAIGIGFARVFPAAASKLGGGIKKLSIAAKSRLAGLLITFKQWMSRLPGVIARGSSAVVAKGFEMVFRFVKAVGTGAVKVFNAVRKWPGQAIAAVVGMGTLLVGAGLALVTGFLDGVKEKAKSIPGVIKSSVVDVAKYAFLGPVGFLIDSPSKVTEKYGEYVARGFAEGLRNGAKETRDALYELIQKLKDAGRTETLKMVESIQKTLAKKLSKRNAIGVLDTAPTKLEKAKEKLDNLRSTAKGFTESVNDSFRELSNITGLEVNNFTEMLNTLKNSGKQADAFVTVMAKLTKLGLNKTTLGQLYDAGPDALKNAQMLLSGGKTGIADINKLVVGKDGILMAGHMAATQGYKEFYKAGIDSAQGLFDGLVSKQKELSKAIAKLSNQLVAELKKQLGIKSPSLVMMKLGQYVPAGFAEGILGGTPEVLVAMRRMIDTGTISKLSAASLPPGVPSQLPMGVGYAGGGSKRSEAMMVVVSGDGLNRKLLEWLREAVRVEGGNVQKVLGST